MSVWILQKIKNTSAQAVWVPTVCWALDEVIYEHFIESSQQFQGQFYYSHCPVFHRQDNEFPYIFFCDEFLNMMVIVEYNFFFFFL